MGNIIGFNNLVDLEGLIKNTIYNAYDGICGIYYVNDPSEYILFDVSNIKL